MRKYRLLPLLLLLYLFTFTPSLFADEPIKVGVYENKPLAFTDVDGNPQGISIDIVEYVAANEGWRLEYVRCEWSACLKMLESGEIDLLGVIAYSDERAEVYDFTEETLVTNWAQLYTRRSSDIQSFLDLEGKNIAVLQEDIHFQRFKLLLTRFGINTNFTEVEDYGTVLELVETHKVDAGLANRVYGAQFEANYDISKSPIIFNPIEVRYAVKKNKNQPLLAALDRHLIDLKEDPKSVYHQSLNRWLEGASRQILLPDWLIWALAFAGGVFFLFLVLNIILRIQVRRKTAELAASEARYRSLVENAPLGIISYDRAGNITAINPTLLDLLGSPSAEATMEINLFTFPLLVESGISATLRRCLEEARTIVAEHPYTSKWRKTINMRLHLAPFRNADGVVTGAQALIEDVSNLKQVEKALAAERNLLRTLIDNLPDSFVYVKDTDSRFITTNAAHLRALGIDTIDEVVGQTDFDFFPRDLAGQYFADEQEVLQSGQPLVDREEPIIDRAGIRKWLLTTKVPLRDSQERIIGLVGMSRDITKYKRLEEQLHRTLRLEAIGTLAGGVAHDFNNMLTAIMGYTGLALEMLPPDSPVRSDIRGIQQTAERAAHLTRQLLTFARRQVIEPRVIDLNELILNVDKMLRRLIGEDIELVTLPVPNLGHIKADPHQIEQILVNLVVNARDAMPHGGKLTIKTANVTLDQTDIRHFPELEPDQYVLLTVSDTGIGMTAEVKSHLFEPFFTTKAVGEGTGLGLATCFGIVKQSGGHILANSEPGRGTTFDIYIPRVKETLDLPVSGNHRQRLPHGTETILLVEDETAVRDLAARLLREQGYSVLEGANGVDALRVARNQVKAEFHLLVTDIVMPQMGGIELVSRLRAIQPNFKVLFISGYTDGAIIPRELPESGSAFLAKPFLPETLVRKVRIVLDGE